MTAYEPARWRIRPPAPPPLGLLSGESFPGARPSAGQSLLPATGRSPPSEDGSDDADRNAWAQMMSEREALKRTNDEFESKNWPLALPALLPALTVGILEGGGALAGALAAPMVRRGPLFFANKEFRFYAGNNRYARSGMKAHADFKQKVAEKRGWNEKPVAKGPNGEVLKPDAATKGDKFYLELKPNTPSGRRAGAAQARRYYRLTDTPTRPVYYDPNNYP